MKKPYQQYKSNALRKKKKIKYEERKSYVLADAFFVFLGDVQPSYKV